MRHRELAVHHPQGAGDGNRDALGGGHATAAAAGYLAAAGWRHPPGRRRGGPAVCADHVAAAVQRGTAGHERERIPVRIGPARRAPRPPPRSSSRMAGIVARLERTSTAGGRRTTASPKKKWLNFRRDARVTIELAYSLPDITGIHRHRRRLLDGDVGAVEQSPAMPMDA